MSSFAQHPLKQELDYTMRSARRPFSKKFPTIVGILIGLLQMLLNGAIVGLEGGSAAYNPRYDIIYAGFWCSFAFFLTWTSMFVFLCCRKIIRWGLVVAGINLASIAFAVILIVFDSLFIQKPGQCYLGTVCTENSTNINSTTNADGKSRLIKAQLACTVTMLVLNIGYIILFLIIVAITRVSYKPLTPAFQPMPSPHSLSSKTPTNLAMQSPVYSTSRSYPYDSQSRQTTYAEQTAYWRPSTPYLDRVEKF